MSLSPHLIYTCWAFTDEWQPGFVMLGANVRSIPTPPLPFQPIVGIDGFWGLHEWTVYPQPYHHHKFPFLSWIPLHQRSHSITLDILTLPIEKTMWRAHPLKSNCHSVKAALEEPFSAITSQTLFSSIERLMKAYTRSFEALCRLEKEFGAWQDFVEVFRNLQRSLLELSTFLDWWKPFVLAIPFNPLFVRPLAVPYLEMSSCTPIIRAGLWLPIFSSPSRPLRLTPQKKSHCPLDFLANLETTARGYHDRLDTFEPTKELKRTIEKVENKKNDKAGRKAKKARTDTATHPTPLNHSELRCITDVAAAPAWFPEIQGVWKTALGHINHVKLLSLTQTRRFSLPPFISFGVKRQWPPQTFDAIVFWKHGGPLFFGDTWSTDVTAGCDNPTSSLPCRCDVQMTTADDEDVRQVTLFYLNSFHVHEEIKAMKHLQFGDTFEKRWRRQEISVNHLVEMWDPTAGCTDFKFFNNKKLLSVAPAPPPNPRCPFMSCSLPEVWFWGINIYNQMLYIQAPTSFTTALRFTDSQHGTHHIMHQASSKKTAGRLTRGHIATTEANSLPNFRGNQDSGQLFKLKHNILGEGEGTASVRLQRITPHEDCTTPFATEHCFPFAFPSLLLQNVVLKIQERLAPEPSREQWETENVGKPIAQRYGGEQRGDGRREAKLQLVFRGKVSLEEGQADARVS
ncbi:hypothetical protein EI94DRAFT_1705979 [Lactarius quietus]|nr:hypothetical protein EI94DRAFT_1705979 [Lactarius quietus]